MNTRRPSGISIGLVVPVLVAMFVLLPTGRATATDHTYEPYDGDVLNPERGLYEPIELVDETELGWVRDEGFTLAFAYVRLDDYRTTAIPQTYLDRVTRGLEAARTAGIKIIFRASYNFGIGEDDATKQQVLAHIEQLRPVFSEYQDVLVVVQAGFIGAWGEWHSSTNGLDSPEVKTEIRAALLDAVPDSRMVQFRYLPDIETWAPAPLSSSEAYTGSDIARTAHHNDCFLATVDDAGTYWPGPVDDHKTYLAAAAEFVAVGGETCQEEFAANLDRRSCVVATEELSRFHWSFLNSAFHEPTLQIWKDGGCWDEITHRLGYRYRLTTASLPDQVVAGATFGGSITIANDGYATLFNERPVYLVLDGPVRVDLALDTDPRRWSGTTVLSLAEPLPGDLPAGNYRVALWLPDASSTLRGRTEFAVQLANVGVWDDGPGYNVLGDIAVIPATACRDGVGSRFGDVGASNPFCNDVEWLAASGITVGCNPPANDRFCPADPVTRGQMAAFLYRTLHGVLAEGPAPDFTDASGTFAAQITWLGSTGVTRGCNPPSNDRYCPNGVVTRGQMAAFLSRALGLTTAPNDRFIDDEGSVFELDIEKLADAGITRGCNPPTNDEFCPTSPVTREQMAAFLHRALG